MTGDLDKKRLKMRIREVRERFQIPVGSATMAPTGYHGEVTPLAELLEDLEATIPGLK